MFKNDWFAETTDRIIQSRSSYCVKDFTWNYITFKKEDGSKYKT